MTIRTLALGASMWAAAGPLLADEPPAPFGVPYPVAPGANSGVAAQRVGRPRPGTLAPAQQFEGTYQISAQGQLEYVPVPIPGPAAVEPVAPVRPTPAWAPTPTPGAPWYSGVNGGCEGCNTAHHADPVQVLTDAGYPLPPFPPKRWYLPPNAYLPIGCSNHKAETMFLFGSCRQFFNEGFLSPPPR